jgi:hypothetical protein
MAGLSILFDARPASLQRSSRSRPGLTPGMAAADVPRGLKGNGRGLTPAMAKITLQGQAAQATRMHAEEAGSPRIPLEFSLPAFAKPVCAGGLCCIWA